MRDEYWLPRLLLILAIAAFGAPVVRSATAALHNLAHDAVPTVGSGTR